MPRIPLLERGEVSDQLRPIHDAFIEKRGVVPNMIKTVAQGLASLLKTTSRLPGINQNRAGLPYVPGKSYLL